MSKAEIKPVLIEATIYRSADLPAPRSRIRVWDQENKTSFVCWSSANWNWLAGIVRFKGADGQQYALIMGESNIDIERSSQLWAQHGKEYVAPVMPELPAGEAAFLVTEGNPTAEALSPVTALHQIYDSDGEKLQAAFEGRVRAKEEREEFLRHNPPRPKNITIRYWRTPLAA